MEMIRIACSVGALLLSGALIFPACSNEIVEEPVVKLPPKEHTWVRKETVKKTKDAFFAKTDEAALEIPLNDALLKRLMESKQENVEGSVKDVSSCLAVLKPLDKKRTEVQKAGGVWHAFERSPEVRGLSDYAMQTDSTMNKLIASLRHLCKTAKGLPKDNISHMISKKIAEKGKEAVAQEFKDLGDAEEDIKIWLEYADYWIKNKERDLDYKTIEGLMAQVQPMIDFYEELAKRQVDEKTKQNFLSDAVTLLEAMKKLSSTDEYMVLARNEDKDAPYDNFDPDM